MHSAGRACTCSQPATLNTCARKPRRLRTESRNRLRPRSPGPDGGPHCRSSNGVSIRENSALIVETIGCARSDRFDVPMLKDRRAGRRLSIYRQEVRHSPTNRSSWSKISPLRRSSPLRIRGCSASCVNCCSSRPPPLTYSRSSAVRLSICRPCCKLSLNQAARLCDADKASVIRDEKRCVLRAETYGFSREFMDYVKRYSNRGRTRDGNRRVRCLKASIVHIPDVQADPEYTLVEAQRLGDFRTILRVPMLREGVPIGVLALTRSEVGPLPTSRSS